MIRKKICSMLLALCFTLGLVMSAVPAASAASLAYPERITNRDDKRIYETIDAAGRQGYDAGSYMLYYAVKAAMYAQSFSPFGEAQEFNYTYSASDNVYTVTPGGWRPNESINLDSLQFRCDANADPNIVFGTYLATLFYNLGLDSQVKMEPLPANPGWVTAEGLKSFLMQYAQAGEYLMATPGSYATMNAITFLSCTDAGFYYLQYNPTDGHIYFYYTSYDQYAATCNAGKRMVYLYNANTALNEVKPSIAVETYDADPAAISERSAYVSGKVFNPGNEALLGDGLICGTTVDSMKQVYYEQFLGTVNYDVDLGYNLPTEEMGDSLQPGTTYYYQPFVISNGAVFYGEIKSFTTLPSTKVYTITYNANGGIRAPQAQTKTAGIPLTLSTQVPYREGYTFQGWFMEVDPTSPTGGVSDRLYAPGASFDVDGNVTLMAAWKEDPAGTQDYTVTFDTAGGTLTDSTFYSKTVTYGSVYGALPTPVRNKGDVFAGWYTASGEGPITPDTKVSIAANHTLYAQWDKLHATGISIVTPPRKLTYQVGEKLDTTGLQLKVTYNDGTSKIVDSGFECDPDAFTSEGKKSVIVYYDGWKADFEVTVTAQPPIGDPVIAVSSARVKTGDSVQVTISLENNPGIQSMKLAVYYDPEVLTLTSASIDDAFRNFNGAMAIENLAGQPAILNWVTFGVTDCTLNGTFATLTFQAKDAADGYADSEVWVSYDAEDIFNGNGQNVFFGTMIGVVEVIPYVPGDINGDGVVNNKDITTLFRYLAGVESNVVENALDVNGDGAVNNKDLTRLFQYLSGADVTIY